MNKKCAKVMKKQFQIPIPVTLLVLLSLLFMCIFGIIYVNSGSHGSCGSRYYRHNSY